jgi:WD40 repeat protein
MRAKISPVSTLLAVLVLFLLAASPTQAQNFQTVFLDWHPGGEWLAVSDFDSVRIIEVATGETVNEFPHQSGNPIRPGGPVAWSPDGMSLAFADHETLSIRVEPWDSELVEPPVVTDFAPIRNPGLGGINQLEWSEDGQSLAIVLAGTIIVLNAETSTVQNQFQGYFEVTDISWKSNEQATVLVATTTQRFVLTLDSMTGLTLTMLDLNEFGNLGNVDLPATALTLDQQSYKAVIGVGLGNLLLWDYVSSPDPGRSEVSLQYRAAEFYGFVTDLEWSSTNQHIAAAFDNGFIRIFRADTWDEVWSVNVGQNLSINSIAWSPDASQLAYGMPDGTIAYIDASVLPGYSSRFEVDMSQVQMPFLAWHPDGEWLTVSNSESVRIIEVSSGRVLNEFPRQPFDNWNEGGPVAWSPDGTRLAFADLTAITFWRDAADPERAQNIASFDFMEGREGRILSLPETIQWSLDSQRLAVDVSDVVYIVDGQTGALEQRIAGDFSVNDVAWLNDAGLIVVTRQGYIVTIDASTGEPITYLINYFQFDLPNYTGLALDPAARQAVVGSSQGEIILWNNTASAAPDYSTEVNYWQYGTDYIDSVTDLDWSPTGQYVAAGFRNGRVNVYTADGGLQLESIFSGVADVIFNHVAWSPDGSQLAYGLPDGGYALFDASTLPGYVPMAAVETTPP